MTNWWAALNFILVDLVENQNYCLYNYLGMKQLIARWRPLVKFWSPVQNFQSHWRPGKCNFGPWFRGLFLKSPETFRTYFVSPQRRASKPSYFAILLVFFFFYMKNMVKDQVLNTSGLQFDNWLSGPKESSRLPGNRKPLNLFNTYQIFVFYFPNEAAHHLF